jgi:hypothetical protein
MYIVTSCAFESCLGYMGKPGRLADSGNVWGVDTPLEGGHERCARQCNAPSHSAGMHACTPHLGEAGLKKANMFIEYVI